jgi:hypothetical protein
MTSLTLTPAERQQIEEALKDLVRGWSTCPLRPLYTSHTAEEMDGWWMQRYAEREKWVRETAAEALALLAALPQAPQTAWTAVADEMPTPGVTVLAYYTNCVGSGRRIRAVWVPAKFEEADPEQDNVEYDEEKDCYFTPEGWYEQIDNWDDYTACAVHEGKISHWMPLPPPPQLQGAQPPSTTGGDAEAVDAKRWRALRYLMMQSVGASLTANDERLVYEKPTPGAEVRLQWYPNTPVGFNYTEGSTINEAIDNAISEFEDVAAIAAQEAGK